MSTILESECCGDLVATLQPVVVTAPRPEREPAPARREGFEPRPRQRRPVPAGRWAQGIDWPTAIWIGVLHVGALAGPFFFTWKALAVAAFLWWLTGGIGICMGYHRLFSHASFGTSRPVRWLIAFLGGLAGEGSCLHWVANHRKHHALSDQEGDPHSPLDGPWWSHALWFLPRSEPEENEALHRRWAPDLLRDPAIVFLDRTFILWHLLLGAALMAIGWWGWEFATGCSLVVWGMFVRLVFVLHATWAVNSATHLWGYRNYDTSDESRNLWWVALLTFGEGWHNNHHAHPRMARHGHRWWELDLTFATIWLMEKLGVFRNVVRTPSKRAVPGSKTWR